MYATNETIGKTSINLQFLKDQMKHDEWFELESTTPDLKGSVSSVGSVHLILQWIYCRERYFEQALRRVEETLEEETKQKNNIQEHLKHYRSPFKAILEGEDMDLDSDVEHDKLEIEARQGDAQAKLSVEEKKLSKKVDLLAHDLAKKMGYESVPWFVLTQAVLAIYSILTILSMFFRPDFFNVSESLKVDSLLFA